MSKNRLSATDLEILRLLDRAEEGLTVDEVRHRLSVETAYMDTSIRLARLATMHLILRRAPVFRNAYVLTDAGRDRITS